jgi:hypothetical protein
MELHPKTMGDAPTHRFGRNQRWGRAIGWVPPLGKGNKNDFFNTTNNNQLGYGHNNQLILVQW